MAHFLLIYELAPDYLARRPQWRREHLQLAQAAAHRGALLLGGALEAPADRVLLLFAGESEEEATAFARDDPYVREGLVVRWEVRRWRTVIGPGAADPLPIDPDD